MKKYRCRICGSLIEILENRDIRYPIDDDDGEIGEPDEFLSPSSSTCKLQCIKNPKHITGFKYDDESEVTEV